MPPKNLTDHDLLVRIDERVQHNEEMMANHLNHHWGVTIALLAATISSIGLAIAAFVSRG
jgi:ABC-type proline/glycine betaine transport system permease subunit